MTTLYEFHPLANLFPLGSKREHEELADDIKKNGQLEPGILFEGKILDGRNRYIACQMAGVEFNIRDLDPDTEDAHSVVFSKNILRRHLTAPQKAMIVAEFLKRTPGGTTNKEAAMKSGVSEHTIDRAKNVEKHGTDKLKRAVKRGKLGLKPAAALAKLPKSKQDAVILKGTKHAKEVAAALEPRRKPRAFAAYVDVPARAVKPAVEERHEPEIVPGNPVAIVLACYAKHKAEWNALPPAAPQLIVDTIVKALGGE